MRAIMGKKKLMTRIFDLEGRQIPVTVIEVEENTITQLKTKDQDGYEAVQVAAGIKKRLNKPEKGHLGDLAINPGKLFEISNSQQYQVGDKIELETFSQGEKINVTGISKGKGFAGTTKRHGFHLGPKTHGSDNYRRPGSIGSMFPQRVIKGKKMAGHLGATKVTTKNLEIVKISDGQSCIFLKGAVPGPVGSLVLIWSRNEG